MDKKLFIAEMFFAFLISRRSDQTEKTGTKSSPQLMSCKNWTSSILHSTRNLATFPYSTFYLEAKNGYFDLLSAGFDGYLSQTLVFLVIIRLISNNCILLDVSSSVIHVVATNRKSRFKFGGTSYLWINFNFSNLWKLSGPKWNSTDKALLFDSKDDFEL